MPRILLALALSSSLVACGASPDQGPTTDPQTEDPPAADPPSDQPPAEQPPAQPAYPAGTTGLKQGQIFPDVSFEGYRDGTGDWTSLAMHDYFDPDGSKKVTGLYIVVSAQWCAVCQQEAGIKPKEYPDWLKRGARFLMVLGQDNSGKPAQKLTVDQWQTRFHLNFDVGADPKLEFLPKDATGFPTCFVVDPRTMKIVRMLPGVTSDGSIPGLDAIVRRNGG
ncbi:MAG: peroxiredoxin family protein [Polyangiales bacterium]